MLNLKVISEYSPVVTAIFNFNDLRFTYFSENIKKLVGNDAEQYLKGGINYYFSFIDPIHANIISTKIIPLYLEYCSRYADLGKLSDLKFSYEYKIKTKSGKAIWCLHQCTVPEVDIFNYPLFEVFTLSDINAIKKDNLINLVITELNDEGYETVLHQIFQTTDVSFLSNRELQVLKLISDGNTTAKIAKTLFISEHTVKTHRKNIMVKMEVNKSVDITKAAFERGIL